MRVDQTITNITLVAMIPAAVALFATRKAWLKSYSIVLFALTIVDLLANVTGHGGLLWWSPIHWPSSLVLGFDEIVENHGVITTTAGYVADLLIWSAIIAGGLAIWKKKRKRTALELPG
ncbi:MAG: hypothetical protein KA248_12470 [Kiritimatiellae bacterium]|nr:hypothetical protein [Kiritimatiellia bacterium]